MADGYSTPPRRPSRLNAQQAVSLQMRQPGPGQGGGARLLSYPFNEAKPEGWTRFVCFSDTHGLHNEIPTAHIVEGDVLLHAGDFSNTGETEQVKSFAEWLRAYPARDKVVIAGNHDITFHPSYYEATGKARFHRGKGPYSCQETRQALLGSGCCTYLEDEAAEVSGGYRIYGSPWQPEFCDWAFNLARGAECKQAWDRIPADVDLLMTHGPAQGFCDRCVDGFHAGCSDLLHAIRARGIPVSISGHIHEGYGAVCNGSTLFLNASTCTFQYQPLQPPIVFDLPPVDVFRATARAAASSLAAAAARGGQSQDSDDDMEGSGLTRRGPSKHGFV